MMMKILLAIVLMLQCGAGFSAVENEIVITIANITSPVGTARGYYRGDEGYFITTAIHALYFISFGSTTGRPVLVAGLPYLSGSHDGPFLYALLASPSRIVYYSDGDTNRLYMCESKNGILRVVDFAASIVTTMRNNNTVLRFEDTSGLSSLSNMDIALYDDRLYVSTYTMVYEVSGSSGGLSDIATTAVATAFTSLANYVSGLPASTLITSIAPYRNNLYVSLSHGKNLIVSTQLDPTSNKGVSFIAGNFSYTYSYPNIPPIARDGDASSAIVAFPVHLRVADKSNNRRLGKDDSYNVDIYFSEAFPATADYSSSFGSLTIRRCSITTQGKDTSAMISTIAGAAPNSNTTEYQFIGASGSYLDGPTTSAHFGFPISISLIGEEIAVCDYSSNALRLVTTTSALVPTLSPTPPSTTAGGDSNGIRSAHILVIWSTVSVALGLIFICFVLCMYNRPSSEADQSASDKDILMKKHDDKSFDCKPHPPKSPAALSVIKLTAATVTTKAANSIAAGRNLLRRMPSDNWREIPLSARDMESPTDAPKPDEADEDRASSSGDTHRLTLWEKLKGVGSISLLRLSWRRSREDSIDIMDMTADSNESPADKRWGMRDHSVSFEDVMAHNTEDKWHSRAWDEDLDESMVTAL